eukprot:jgi/Mesen1/5185/ME000257S04461
MACQALPLPTPPDGTLDSASHIKQGVWAMIAVFLGYCLMQAPPTLLIRPHPIFWRLIHGLAVLYLVFLTFILFQTRDDARQFMKHLHPDLGIELPERSYGADCRIYTPENPTNKFKNVYDTVLDEFVIAHVLGWYAKAILYRNQLLLWILSVGFELMEVTFHHMLPNFNECWWDSIVLDVLICNWFGIWAGMKTVRYFDGKTYDWVGISRQPSFVGKVRRTMLQFTPATWDRDRWDMLSGPKRFIQVLCLIVVTLTVELSCFFLKYCLWIPPRNPLNSYRLLVWFFVANPALREVNYFIHDDAPMKKLGSFGWLAIALCILEVLICIKFGRGLYPEPMPRWIVVCWSAALLAMATFVIAWSVSEFRKGGQKRSPRKIS